ncbi:MAG: extracellular solute-binding protein [Metallosphaera sp.]
MTGKALTKTQAVLIVVIIVIAAIAIVSIELIPHSAKSSHSSTTTSTTTTVTPTNQSVTVYVAGAYIAILNYLAKQFENQTGIQVHNVPGGAFALASQIATTTPEPANVFVPVAYIQAVQLEGSRNPGWAIAFISDQMSIVYSNYTTQSPYWSQLYSNYTMAMKTNETTYWFNFFKLLSTKFTLGISNPNSDPEGLFANLMFQMAGKLYAHNESYFTDLLKNNPNVKVEPSTADYVAPLKAGELDFTFSYVSYAVSQHLDYFQMPPWLSFGYYPNETSWFSSFNYTISVNGQQLNIRGNPVYLYVTVPRNASDAQAAYEFIEFLVKNVNELSMFHVTPVSPPIIFYNNPNDVPQPIMNLVNSGELKYGGNFSAI